MCIGHSQRNVAFEHKRVLAAGIGTVEGRESDLSAKSVRTEASEDRLRLNLQFQTVDCRKGKILMDPEKQPVLKNFG
jgi:hypothetical protein